MRILSLGAGVQSSAVLMLILEGRIDADAAIFADTGWEPKAVYAHLEVLKAKCADAGFPLHVVSAGNIRYTAAGRGAKLGSFDVPFFILNADGGKGMVQRQCTNNFKITPVRRKSRELMFDAGHKTVTQIFGISSDEIHRMKSSRVKYITHEYPLIDMGWRRVECIGYLRSLGINAPRSACIGCPYHSDHEWRDMRDNNPGEFADAIAFEREVQDAGLGDFGIPYLHPSRVPLDQVDLTTPEDHGQLSWADECEGMCGV